MRLLAIVNPISRRTSKARVQESILGNIDTTKYEVAINSNYPGEEVDAAAIHARKLHADLFIDDRAVGGLPDWGAIYEVVHNRWREYYEHIGTLPREEKKGLFGRLRGK